MRSIRSLAVLMCLSVGWRRSDAARFVMTGPTLTVTLKDPAPSLPAAAEAVGGAAAAAPPARLSWLNLGALSPTATWELSSARPPLPAWLPALKQLALRASYEYHVRPRTPTVLAATARFSTPAGDLVVQPRRDLAQGATDLVVEASRGPHWVEARLHRQRLASLTGSFLLSLPYASLSSVRLQPTLSLAGAAVADGAASAATAGSGLRVEAVTGAQGRTRGVLNWQYPHPSLTVLHQIDARNSIAPTIFLDSARMMYQWTLLLRAGSSLVTRVDPTSAIYVTWTDTSASGSGSWVTDLKLPLAATTLKELAADVRVRRQFSF